MTTEEARLILNLDEFDDKQDECEGKMVIDDSYASILQENTSSVTELLLQVFEELKPFGFCKDCWETNGKPKAMKGERNEKENKTMRM